DDLLTAIEGQLTEAFDIRRRGGEARQALARRAGALVDLCVDSRLKVFLLRVADAAQPHPVWIESLGTLLTEKPPKDWADGDLTRFELALADLRRSFLHLERLAIEAHRAHAPDDDTAIIRIGVTTLDAPEQERVLFVRPEQQGEVGALRER